jgi:hypothetical protein
MLDTFALIVLVVLIAAGIALVVLIGNLPGKLARGADHPQADAIALLAWIGLFTGGLGWLLALVWARYRPGPGVADLERRISDLEQRLQQQEVDA